METDIKDIIANIITFLNAKNDWSKNEKMRYAYVELGKHVHKNIEFFYSLYNLMRERELTITELKEIYETDVPIDNVICRNAAKMLKMIYDEIGIKSEIREFREINHYELQTGEIDIKHCFLVAKGDNGKNYFLTLTPDLANIQLGLQTENFASEIEYTRETPGTSDAEIVYEGEPIEHEVMSDAELYEIDKKIGYLSFERNGEDLAYYNVALELLAKANLKYRQYLELLSMTPQNSFYKGLISAFESEDSESIMFSYDSLTDDKIDNVKDYVCRSILKKSLDYIEVANAEVNELLKLIDNKQYDDLLYYLTDILNKRYDRSKEDMFTPKALTTGASRLFSTIEKMRDNNLSKEELFDARKSFSVYIYNIAKLYIPDKYKPTINGRKYSNEYIAHKIKTLFPDIFDFGYGNDFTDMNVGEKVVVMQKVFDAIFPELYKDEAKPRNNTNPIENRIKTSVIYDREEERYQLLINIDAFEAEEFQNNIVLIYDYNSDRNSFVREDEDISVMDIISDKDRYIVFSRNKLMIHAEEMIKPTKKATL